MTGFKPASYLAPFVEMFWSGEFNTTARPFLAQKVVPNGFVELIIHMSNLHCQLSKDGRWSSTPDYLIIGLYTSPYEVRFTDAVDVFGIRFKPEAIYNLFGIPAADFHEQYEDMELVLGAEFRAFCSVLRTQETVSERIRLAEAYLSKQLDRSHSSLCYVNHAAELIRASGGHLRIEDLCSRVYISLRQLEREFKQRVGITPKMYMRISRLNSVQRILEEQKALDLTRIAFNCGYADQAHFIRDFRSLTGTRPGIFTRNQREYIVHISSPRQLNPAGIEGEILNS